MPHIPEEIIEQIRSRADIVDLVSQVTPVHKRGNAFWACCPFHHEKTPSFKISQERQSYYCFGCKKSGNVISFVKDTVNTDFVGAIKWLADRYGIVIPEESSGSPQQSAQRRQWKDNCYRLLNDAAVWFHDNLKRPEARLAQEYINSRELDAYAVDRFMLGYSPDSRDALINWAKKQGYTNDQLIATGLAAQKDNSKDCYDRFRGRLTFPIWDELGRVVGFSARILDAEAKMAKYVNSPETDFFQKGHLLYAYNFARTNFKKSGRALVCEGQLDVIACHRAGLDHAIAAQGTAFTEQHARMLKRSTSNVTLAFDADTAGQKATIRTVALLHAQGLSVDVATLPDGDDPDSIFRRGGAEALNAIMNNIRPALHYLLDAIRATHDLTRPEALAETARQLLEAIRPIPDPVAKTAHCQWLAQSLNLPENVILQELQIVDSSHPSPLANALRKPAPPKPSDKTLPAFTMPLVNESTLQHLLALLLRFEDLALALAANDDIIPILPDNPLGHAINLVLANVEQGEWLEAEDALALSELAEHPAVGKILAENICDALVPTENDTKEQQLTKAEKKEAAFNDCINELMSADIDQKIALLKQEINSATKEQKTQLQNQLFQLVAQKKQFQVRS